MITLKRRTHNLAQRRLLTGADHARADAPSRQLRIPAIDTLNNSLNHKPKLSLPASRLEAHGTPALAPSASAKDAMRRTKDRLSLFAPSFVPS
jgi:hypothetical protein